MAPRNSVVGIIEIDEDPMGDATLDADLGQTLRHLRRPLPESDDADALLTCSSEETDWEFGTEEIHDSVVVLRADLCQLHHELERELACFLQRLLMTY